MITALQSTIRRTRQHHAIEHATLLLLAERFPGRRMAGYSDPIGFTLLADVPAEAVQRALTDAMLRLHAGESHLAIHPYCGTNLLATGVLVTLAALASTTGAQRDVLSRFARALVLVLPALVIGPPVGSRLQRYTTLPSIGDRWVKDVRPLEVGGLRATRITFA